MCSRMSVSSACYSWQISHRGFAGFRLHRQPVQNPYGRFRPFSESRKAFRILGMVQGNKKLLRLTAGKNARRSSITVWCGFYEFMILS